MKVGYSGVQVGIKKGSPKRTVRNVFDLNTETVGAPAYPHRATRNPVLIVVTHYQLPSVVMIVVN